MSARHKKEDNVRKTKSGHPRCQEVVMAYWTNWPSFHQCSRRAKVGDRCGQHDPAHIKAKEDAKEAAWDEDMARRKIMHHGRHFLNVLRQIAEGHNDPRTLAKEVIEEFER